MLAVKRQDVIKNIARLPARIEKSPPGASLLYL